jgi:UDP-GlcNAc:undecaprenyl-phosphate/decaprenyl-phosphate GlcNAc-1-phosphate transferase
MLVVRHVFALGFSFLLSFYLIPILIKAALQKGFLDNPDGKIKVHENPIPHFGGIAIYIGFVATLAITYPFENVILWLILGSTLLLFVGLIDDLKALRPLQKFGGQIIAVLCFLKGGFALKNSFFRDPFLPLNFFVSGFWMLSVINAFNLVDVMDGLSSTIALVAAMAFFVIALLFKLYTITLLLLSFIGALLAFFLYNKPPAKIYLGDAGAMFVGGFLSSVPFLFPWSSKAKNAYYVPVVILAIPLMEVFFLVIIRACKGIPFYQGSPHHFCLYLLKKGWRKKEVLLFTGVAGAFLSLSAIFFFQGCLSLLWIVSLGGVFFLCGVGLFFK